MNILKNIFSKSSLYIRNHYHAMNIEEKTILNIHLVLLCFVYSLLILVLFQPDIVHISAIHTYYYIYMAIMPIVYVLIDFCIKKPAFSTCFSYATGTFPLMVFLVYAPEIKTYMYLFLFTSPIWVVSCIGARNIYCIILFISYCIGTFIMHYYNVKLNPETFNSITIIYDPYVLIVTTFIFSLLIDFIRLRYIRQIKLVNRFQKETTEIVRNICHEIRTPLYGMHTSIEELKQFKGSSEKEYKRKISILEISTNNLNRVVNDVLFYEDLRKERSLNFKYTVNEINEIVEEIILLYQEYCSMNQKTIHIEFKEDKQYLWIDKTRFQQIIQNLILNSILHAESDTIYIEYNLKPNHDPSKITLNFTLYDYGVGIPKNDSILIAQNTDDIKHIKSKGSGLGIKLIFKIVENFNGNIKLISEKNKGTKFEISLVLKKAEAPTLENSKDTYNLLENKKILVAEDDLIGTITLNKLLQRKGIEAKFTKNGKECLEEYIKNHSLYQFIFMDCQMPILDGFEATKQIRKFEKNKNINSIPIIALTANVLQKDRDRCIAAGMNHHVSKPFNQEELFRQINDLLKKDALNKKN